MKNNKKSINLIENFDKKYIGKYVITPSFQDRHVVAYDKNPLKALEKAREKGYEHPVIVYINDPKIPFFFFSGGLERKIA